MGATELQRRTPRLVYSELRRTSNPSPAGATSHSPGREPWDDGPHRGRALKGRNQFDLARLIPPLQGWFRWAWMSQGSRPGLFECRPCRAPDMLSSPGTGEIPFEQGRFRYDPHFELVYPR